LAHIQSELLATFKSQESRPSKLQRDVAAALTRIGWDHVFEFVTEEGLSLDMAHPGTMTAIEVDGPFHYLESKGKQRVENGRTRFKSRIVRQLGWTLIHVPYFEWDALIDAAAQDSYLQSKL